MSSETNNTKAPQQEIAALREELKLARSEASRLEMSERLLQRTIDSMTAEIEEMGKVRDIVERYYQRKLAAARSETIQECADWITETELALPIAWHMGTKDELVKRFALCLASCLRMETLDKHCYLCSEETLDSARRVQEVSLPRGVE